VVVGLLTLVPLQVWPWRSGCSRASTNLLWVVAILGLAGSRLARPRTPTAQGRTRAARHVGANLNEAVLPLYVLHETVVVAVAYAVLSWPVAAGVQYLAISLTRWPARWPCMSSVSAAPGHPGAVRPQAPGGRTSA
jgi:hypothetical protein